MSLKQRVTRHKIVCPWETGILIIYFDILELLRILVTDSNGTSPWPYIETIFSWRTSTTTIVGTWRQRGSRPAQMDIHYSETESATATRTEITKLLAVISKEYRLKNIFISFQDCLDHSDEGNMCMPYNGCCDKKCVISIFMLFYVSCH